MPFMVYGTEFQSQSLFFSLWIFKENEMKYIIGCWIWIVTITSLRHYITDQEIISDDNDVQTPRI